MPPMDLSRFGDVLHHVAGFLASDREALRSVSLVSRRARAAFQPRLFRRLRVASPAAASALLAVDREELWRAVRILWVVPYGGAGGPESDAEGSGPTWEAAAALLAARCPGIRMVNIGNELPAGRGMVPGRLEVRMAEGSMSLAGVRELLRPLKDRVRWLYMLGVTVLGAEEGTVSLSADGEDDPLHLPRLSLLALTVPKPKPPADGTPPSDPVPDPGTLAVMLEVLRLNAATLKDLMLYTMSPHPAALEPLAVAAAACGVGEQLGFLGVLGAGAGALIRRCPRLRHLQLMVSRLAPEDRKALLGMTSLEFVRLEDDFVHLISPCVRGGLPEETGLRTLHGVIANNPALDVLGIANKPCIDKDLEVLAQDAVVGELGARGMVRLESDADSSLSIFVKKVR